MKYIDAEKLRKLLANRYEEITVSILTDEGGLESFYRRSEIHNILKIVDSLQQEQTEVDLEKFTEKMNDWKARYNHPDNIPIKATMAFTARMFYMYPKVARKWYDSLPKVTLD